MVYFWTAVCTFIVGLACRLRRDPVGLAWLNYQWSSDYPALYKLRSVGQHYGMDTGLLDASASIPVALWFGTHDFGSGEHRTADSAVLYRVDRYGLRDVENWLRAIPEHDGEFDAASVDIRDTPPTIAPRPSRQHGWSLVGWDHPRLVICMAAKGFLRRYIWPTGQAPSATNNLTREDLVPSVDPTGFLFRVFWETQPQSLQEVQHWIDRCWNVAAETPIVLDENGAWMDHLSREVERIYDAHAERLRGALAAEGVTFTDRTETPRPRT